MIMEAGLPDEVRKAIEDSYGAICEEGVEVSVAVRSSATAEDLPTASFAGQQSSFLNVVGKKEVADAVLKCLASVFTDRAITYRVHNDFDHMAVKVCCYYSSCCYFCFVLLISSFSSTVMTGCCRCSNDGAIGSGVEWSGLHTRP